ncbi:hypothetical protein GCM10009430_38890 [Aquimarina litoralis]|uniref:Uncharacterized protein n=1 Tax=Aquimarina litoralis TaxID=584605 RepID=A0ABN1J548_9FLAO
MKKVLLAAALIGGTFFSANAEGNEIANDDLPGCVTTREIVEVHTVYFPNGNSATEYVYGNVTRCTSAVVTGVAVKVIK